MNLRILIVFFFLTFLQNSYSQEDAKLLPSESSQGKVLNTFMFEVGSARRADTYLSPIHYSGWTGKLGYEHIRAFEARPLMWKLNVNLGIDRTVNKVKNSAMLGAQIEGRWSLLRRWRVSNFAELGAGGAATLDAGALYLSRNGNNPVAANASLTADVAGYASVCFRLGRLPVVANYHVALPVVGGMFAPDYAQLYYEIYLGDHKGLLSAAYWGRYFRIDQMLSVNLNVGPHQLTLGYGVDVLSTKVHDIISRRIDHTVVVGITTGWLSYYKK